MPRVRANNKALQEGKDLTPNPLMEEEMEDIELTEQTLKEVLEGMVSAFNSESEKTDSFKSLFREGSAYTGLLRELDNQTMKSVLNACRVLEKKEIKITKELFNFLLALPFLSHNLEKHIRETDGSCCCVDKSFYLLSEQLKKLIAR
jgi:hypothetical protein